MFNMSASEGPKFAETVDEMTERLRKLGPSPLRNAEPVERAQSAPSEQTEGEKENGS
jgi:DNA-binding ferritin-like protein